jgi:hypothetical protein
MTSSPPATTPTTARQWPACRPRPLDLVGLGLHADRKEIDKVVKGLSLHA